MRTTEYEYKLSQVITLTVGLFILSLFVHNIFLSFGGITIGLIVLPVSLFGSLWIYNKIGFDLNGANPYFIFVLYAILGSVLGSPDKEDLLALVYLVLCLVVFLLTISCVKWFDLLQLHGLIYYVIFGVTLVGLFFYVYSILNLSIEDVAEAYGTANIEVRRDVGFNPKGFVLVDGGSLRYNGFYFDPNYWSLYVIISFAFLIVVKEHIQKSAFWMCLFAILLSGLLTLSRGFIISLLCACLVFWIVVLVNRPVQAIRMLFAFIAILVFFSMIFFVVYSNVEAFASIVDGKFIGEAEAGETPRLTIWADYTARMFLKEDFQHLLFGFGMTRDFRKYGFFAEVPHNLLLYILSQLGLVGLFLYASLYVRLIYILFKIKTKVTSLFTLRYGLLFCLIMLTVASFFLDPLFHYPFWVLSGIIVGVGKVSELKIKWE